MVDKLCAQFNVGRERPVLSNGQKNSTGQGIIAGLLSRNRSKCLFVSPVVQGA